MLKSLKTSQGWYRLSDLQDRIYRIDYEFLFNRRYRNIQIPYYYANIHPYSAYGNPLGWEFGSISNEEDGWKRVEGRFIGDILVGPLFWMGLVDLGGVEGKPNVIDAIRLTALGAWVLGSGPKPPIPVEGGQVIVQPNFQVMAFDPIPDGVLTDLSAFCDLVSAERVVEFRLSRASVYRGQRSGWQVEEIRSFLTRLTSSPLPDNVSKTLDEWQALHERITIHPSVSVLHGASPADLDALLDISEIRKKLGRRMDAHLMAIAPQSAGAVYQALLQNNRLPLRRAAAKTGQALPERSVEIGDDGRLKFTVAAPDLYLHGHLLRFAEADGDGYRLTPASLRRAAQSGLSLEAIATALQTVAVQPLSEILIQRIRAWSGHYGSATIDDATLIQFKNASALAELMQDAEIGPLLKSFKPKDIQALARVRPQDMPRLKRLLEDRGVELK